MNPCPITSHLGHIIMAKLLVNPYFDSKGKKGRRRFVIA